MLRRSHATAGDSDGGDEQRPKQRRTEEPAFVPTVAQVAPQPATQEESKTTEELIRPAAATAASPRRPRGKKPSLARGLSCFGHLEDGRNRKPYHAHASGSLDTVSGVNLRGKGGVKSYDNEDRAAYFKLYDTTPAAYALSLRHRLDQLNRLELAPAKDIPVLTELHKHGERMGSTFTSAACFPEGRGKSKVIGMSLGDSRPFVIRINKRTKDVEVIPLYVYEGNLSDAAERERIRASDPNPFADKAGTRLISKNPALPGSTLALARSTGDFSFPQLIRKVDVVEKTIDSSPDCIDLIALFTDGTFERNPPVQVRDEVLLRNMILDFLHKNPEADLTQSKDRRALLDHIYTLARAAGSADDITGVITLMDAPKCLLGFDGHGGSQFADGACKWTTEKIIQDCGLEPKITAEKRATGAAEDDSDSETTIVLSQTGESDPTQSNADAEARADAAPVAAARSPSRKLC